MEDVDRYELCYATLRRKWYLRNTRNYQQVGIIIMYPRSRISSRLKPDCISMSDVH